MKYTIDAKRFTIGLDKRIRAVKTKFCFEILLNKVGTWDELLSNVYVNFVYLIANKYYNKFYEHNLRSFQYNNKVIPKCHQSSITQRLCVKFSTRARRLKTL